MYIYLGSPFLLRCVHTLYKSHTLFLILNHLLCNDEWQQMYRFVIQSKANNLAVTVLSKYIYNQCQVT
jgi:hypothetical protein